MKNMKYSYASRLGYGLIGATLIIIIILQYNTCCTRYKAFKDFDKSTTWLAENFQQTI